MSEEKETSDAGDGQDEAATESAKAGEAAAESTKEAELKEKLHDMGVMPREDDEMPEITPRRLTRTIVLGLVALVLIIAGVYWWHERGESADETATADTPSDQGTPTAMNGAPMNGGPMMGGAPSAHEGEESAATAPTANPPAPPPGWGPPGRLPARPMPPRRAPGNGRHGRTRRERIRYPAGSGGNASRSTARLGPAATPATGLGLWLSGLRPSRLGRAAPGLGLLPAAGLLSVLNTDCRTQKGHCLR